MFLIFLTFALKWKNSETDRELMTFLVCLTIADLFIAVGYLTGAIRFIGADDTDSMPTRVYYNSILRTDENVDGRKSHKRERNTTKAHHNSTNTNDK
jgi:hypothetical protein